MKTFADFGIDIPFGRSGEIDVLCPQCSHKRKKRRDRCLSVNIDKGTWMCHHPHCGWTGSLGEKDWRDSTFTPPRAAPKVYEPPKPLPATTPPTTWDRVVAYFAGRGIDEATLQAFGITAAEQYCGVCQRAVGFTLFPYRVDGVHVNTKYRDGHKHFRMDAGARRVLYNLDACHDAEEVIIVEGEIDALSCHQAGFPHVLSVPDGAPAPDATSYASKFDFLDSGADLFARVKRVILATDDDAPGRKLMDELARRLGPEKCSRVIWLDGIKDANECLTRFGPDVLALYLSNPEPFPVEGIYTGRDLLPELDRLLDHNVDRGVDFGPPLLGEYYRVKTGQMTVATGIPSHGKSTAVDQLLMWLAERHDWRFTLFSPEQQPLWMHQRNLIELHACKGFRGDPPLTKDAMHAANAWVSDRFSFILPEQPSIPNILDLARVEVFRKGVRGIVIDPWNELEHARPRHLSETEYISDALSQFRRFARNHDVHVWVIAHPTKMRKLDDGTEPIPGLWDISGSAHFRNKADVGLTVWRDITAENNEVDLIITKMRWLDTGKPGRIRYRYDPTTKRLWELGIVTED